MTRLRAEKDAQALAQSGYHASMRVEEQVASLKAQQDHGRLHPAAADETDTLCSHAGGSCPLPTSLQPRTDLPMDADTDGGERYAEYARNHEQPTSAVAVDCRCIHICIYIYIYCSFTYIMYIHIYTHTHTHTHKHYTHTRTHTHTYAYTYINIHIYTYTYISPFCKSLLISRSGAHISLVCAPVSINIGCLCSRACGTYRVQ